ncbi:MAG: phosphatase PAP2 family protein [Rhodospirillales bacterium]
MQVATQSFPNGHAMMSAITYLTLGALLARTQPRRRVKAYLLTSAVLLTLLVGTSRVYLGVHWPTDVLAGWWAGAGWAMLCRAVLRRLQRRGTVEQEGAGR